MLLIRLFVFALIVFICKFRLIYYLYFGDFLFGWLFLCVFFFLLGVFDLQTDIELA